MPAALTSSASVITIRRICGRVAPTDESRPNCRVRSDTEMEKAL